MRIYTRHGDLGQTDLIGGPRVGKDHPRVVAVGCVDELNAALGLALACCEDDATQSPLITAQHRLFDLGADLARHGPYKPTPGGSNTAKHGFSDAAAGLERLMDTLDADLGPLTGFILPGGCESAARLHLARTVCRRAERAAVELHAAEPVDPSILVYLNRLSDLLFVLARRANQRSGRGDVLWEKSDA